MRIAIIVILLLGGIIVSPGFAKKEARSQADLMQEYIDSQLEETRVVEWKKCGQNTVKDAEHYVDSIIYQQVNFNISDSLRTPGKPLKPSRPFDTLRLDTTPIIPILDSIKG